MSATSSPTQNLPLPTPDEFAHDDNQTPPFGARGSSFRGFDHSHVGALASPREVVGNILSSNLTGSPLSRAGYDHGAIILSSSHTQFTIPSLGSSNTAITFIHLLSPQNPRSFLVHKMISGSIPCNCRTWLYPQKQASPHPSRLPRPMISPPVTV